MPTRISFSTTWPERMGDLAGKPTRFPQKILKGTYNGTTYWIGECPKCKWIGSTYHTAGGQQIADTGDYSDIGCPKCFTDLDDSDYDFGYYGQSHLHPKTTTIRSNYEYWKSKEGQLLQPFFWAGKPRRSKQVVFCPEVRLAKVDKIHITKYVYFPDIDLGAISPYEERRLIENEGFDHPDHFWRWFDKDFDGALLELESVEG